MFDHLLSRIIDLLWQLFHYLSWVGGLSAFYVFAFSQQSGSFLRRLFLWFGGLSLTAPILWGAILWGLTGIGYEAPSDTAIWIWSGLWMGGVIFALVWLRVAMPKFNALLARFSKASSLQRNVKTDVRQIGRFLPSAATKFDPLKFINLSKGIFIGLDEFKKPVYINSRTVDHIPHIQAIGTTGAGKGVSLGLMAAQFLERGEAVFYCDPKNDEWAAHVLYAAAQRTGKPFHFVNLNRPNGAQFDPFHGATEDEIFELFQAGFSLTEKGDASDFYGIADRREAALTAKLMAAQGLNIAQAFAARQGLMDGAEKFAGRLREMAEMPSINALPGTGLNLAKVIEEGGCVYFVGSMRNDLVKTVQRILLVRMLQLAERRDRIAGKRRPVCIVLDEVKYHLSRPALEGLGAARDKGVHLILAHQSLGDLRDCTKDLNPDAVVDAVVENCRIKICYRVMNPETAEWLASMSGEIQVDDEVRKVQKNLAQAEIVLGERNIRQAARYFIDVNMLLNLPSKVAVVYGEGLPKFVSIQPLSTVKMQEAVQVCIVNGAETAGGADAIGLCKAQGQAAMAISLD